MDLISKLMSKGIYPHRMVTETGFVVFAYLQDIDGNISGVKEKPDLKEWLMYRFHIQYNFSEN
jgi:hypothetical protein